MHFSEDDIEAMQYQLGAVYPQYTELANRYVHYKYRSNYSHEFAAQGFVRRLKIIVRCIHKVFMICDPNDLRILDEDSHADMTIYIQSFVFNLFGALDNLARIWVYENNIIQKNGRPLSATQIGLSKKCDCVRHSFPKELGEYLEKIDSWFDHIENFRHALAHRIPLYIPPYNITNEKLDEYLNIEQDMDKAIQNYEFDKYDILSAQQRKLGVFQPVMLHSFVENGRPTLFHPQILSNYKTLVEIASRLKNCIESQGIQ